MRRCLQYRSLSQREQWLYRGLLTSSKPRHRPHAGKLLSNEELLDLITGTNDDATAFTDSQFVSEDVHTPSSNVKTSLSASQLPQSPLTDARLSAARLRHKEPKPTASKELTPFQVKLRKNPYGVVALLPEKYSTQLTVPTAHALSTSPRHCIVTGVRLPSYFLLNFGLATHPTTGAKWHLPRIAAEPDPSRPPTSPEEVEGLGNHNPEVHDHTPITQSATANQHPRGLSGSHLLSTRQTLHRISHMRKPEYRAIIPYRWKNEPGIKATEIVWREDMSTFVLEILRKRLARDLIYLAGRPAAYVATCKGWESVRKHEGLAAVLWLGQQVDAKLRDDAGGHKESVAETAATEENKAWLPASAAGPPAYAMVKYKRHHIPVYNLSALLGPEHLRGLREGKPSHYGGELAVMKAKNGTVKAQLDLWRLLGYLAPDEKV